jgi:hypothetical protein
MKSMRAIWRFISTSWLVAAPLVIVFLLIAIPLCLAIVGAIIERVLGHAAAESFSSLWFGALMWGAELVLVLTPIALAAYGMVCLVRWLIRKKEP